MADIQDDTPRAATFPQGADALPAQLRALRLDYQLTQRALARRAGVPLSVIGQLERGQRGDGSSSRWSRPLPVGWRWKLRSYLA